MVNVVPGASTIVLTMPANLRFRDIAVRSVTAACHLIGKEQDGNGAASSSESRDLDLQRQFDSAFISAFSEIFNNISIHAYNRQDGELKLELIPGEDHLTVKIEDMGSPFDIDTVPAPELESLPEGGMGIHIARACLDRLDYTPGPPNKWVLTKYLQKNGK